METLIRRCAGLDVHQASVVACVRCIDEHGELQQETVTFGATTPQLLKLFDWLSRWGSDASGDGVDRGVLETGLLLARKRV
jgi:hypothetical protein